MNKIILYIAISKDGFIADINGDVDWLPQPKTNEDLEVVGYAELIERVDTIVMGSKSFKQIVSFGDWAWVDKHTYVFSSQPIKSQFPHVTITNDNPVKFMQKMKVRKSGKDIWLLGGAELTKSFAEDGLIDEIILTIIPQNLGEGIPLGLSLDAYDFKSERLLMDDMTQRIYLRK